MNELNRSPGTSPAGSPRALRFVIVGAGLSGVLAAIKLQEAGYENFVILEKAARLGGTWRDNTYPGVACDIPAHLYSYSFALNPDWSRLYAPGAEILAYIERVAERHGVVERIRFGREVSRCAWRDGRWQVHTVEGEMETADVLIAASGVTHHPRMPAWEGLSRFEGAAFHSARWDHDVALDGRRIGVVGTGSSAVQIVAALGARAAKLTLFQRTAQWIAPRDDYGYSEADRAAFRAQPDLLRTVRKKIEKRFTETFSNAIVDAASDAFKMIEQRCHAQLEQGVRDPALREKLRPQDRVACKRLVVSSDFYDALQRPNAELVTEAIAGVERQGIRTQDGQLHELDVLVLATGFHTDRFLRPAELIGPEGARLSERWAAGPVAYLTVAVPGFPNFFMLNGPSSPIGNYSLIEVAEVQMRYILALVEHLRAGRCAALSPREDATERYEQERAAAARQTVWASGCSSWYLDDRGVPAPWPWTIERFRGALAEPDLDSFELA